MLFQHGYALIVGVGRSAYPAWSLPTTAGDAAALRAALTDPTLCAYPSDDVVRLSLLAAHLSRTVPDSARRLCAAEQTPFYDWSTEDFPVALLRGGKGLPAEGWQAGEDVARPADGPTYSATLSGSGAIAQDHSVAAGAGGIAIGRIGRG